MIARRDFCAGGSMLAAAGWLGPAKAAATDLGAGERARVLRLAQRYLGKAPKTIAAIPAPRSPGGRHDYYSEADYWWPDPANPGGAYVRRDGFSNPAKFDDHRQALITFGIEMPALTAAWHVSGDARYARHAIAHLHAWFVDPATRMTPNLNHAQAIIGHDTGRAIGIIDTLQIVEVAHAALLLERENAPGYPSSTLSALRAWFASYLDWLTTSPNGIDERDQRNNHGTCWLLQAVAFATLAGRPSVLDDARRRFRTIIIPNHVAPDGSQPFELARTKAYSYSLFNLDAMAALAWLLSKPGDDLWRFRTADGRSIAGAIGFMAPFIRDRGAWPHPPDVEYFDKLPVRQPALLFGGLALGRSDWVGLWRTLDPDPTTPEIIRNYPIRQPVLWVAR